MKKFFVIAILSVVLCGCSNKTDEYERLAKEQLEKVIKRVAKNPDTYKISEVKTAYKQDSICVIRFIGHGENSFGGSSASRYEFVMVSTQQNTEDQITMCMLTDLDEGESVLKTYKKMNVTPTSKDAVSVTTREDSIYYYCAYATISSKSKYSSVVKDLTRNKALLQMINEEGL